MTPPSNGTSRDRVGTSSWRDTRAATEPASAHLERPDHESSGRDAEPPSSKGRRGAQKRRRAGAGWLLNLVMFVATVGSVFLAGVPAANSDAWAKGDAWSLVVASASYAVPLLAILIFHEFGHYIAARLHGVPASLPYFLPLPVISLFGTLGAVILMPRRIRSAKALLDIGAAGPLAGMALAVPLMVYGLSLSEVGPQPLGPYLQEGQSLLYMALKYAVHGRIPPGYDVLLHPTAFAAWAGFLITFFNLLPYSQLDGGHVAYALLGERHHRIARWILYVPPLLVAYNLATHLGPYLAAKEGRTVGSMSFEEWLGIGSATQWMVLWGVLFALRRMSGPEHPPVNDASLGPGRRWVGIVTLVFFVLLFMPSPMVFH